VQACVVARLLTCRTVSRRPIDVSQPSWTHPCRGFSVSVLQPLVPLPLEPRFTATFHILTCSIFVMGSELECQVLESLLFVTANDPQSLKTCLFVVPSFIRSVSSTH
jgi:hypothetical protein